MNERTIEQKLGDVITSRNNAQHEASTFNDYGNATGFQDDLSQLESDFSAMISSIRIRYEILRRRIRQHERDIKEKK